MGCNPRSPGGTAGPVCRGTPSCGGNLGHRGGRCNGGQGEDGRLYEGSATVKLLKDTTELASYAVAVSPPDTASLSPVPSTLTVGTAATEFTLTTNVSSTSVKVKGHPGYRLRGPVGSQQYTVCASATSTPRRM